MKNEVLCKILAHNLCCCISAWYELGIEPTFGANDSGEPATCCRWCDPAEKPARLSAV